MMRFNLRLNQHWVEYKINGPSLPPPEGALVLLPTLTALLLRLLCQVVGRMLDELSSLIFSSINW
jgi:hypothetical protein